MMKFKALIAMLVALMVMVLPMSALAAQTDADVIQIANPIISMDGEQIADLEGLAVQLAAMGDERVATLIIDLIAGGKNAGSAMMQIDNTGDNIVGLLGGMSSAYMVNAVELGTMLSEQMTVDEESAMMMDAIADLIAQVENWTLPAELASIIEAQAVNFTIGEPYTDVNAQGTTLNYTTFSGDLTPGIVDVMSVIEADSLINEMLAMIDPYASLTGMTEAFEETGLNFTIEGTVGFDDYGYAADVDVKLNVLENGSSLGVLGVDAAYDASSNVAAVLNVYALDETGAKMIDFTANITTAPGTLLVTANLNTNGGPSMSLMASGMLNDSMATFTMNIDAADYYGDGVSANLYANATPIAGTNGVNFNVSLNCSDGYDNYRTALTGSLEEVGSATNFNAALTVSDSYDTSVVELSIGSDYITGAANAKLSLKDYYNDMYFACAVAPAAELPAGMDSSNQVSIEVYDGYSTVGVTCDVNTLTSAVDTDSFYINPVAAINLLTMDDAQLAAAQAEIETVVNTILETIASAYPELGL